MVMLMNCKLWLSEAKTSKILNVLEHKLLHRALIHKRSVEKVSLDDNASKKGRIRNDDGEQSFACVVQANIVKGGARDSNAPLSKAWTAKKIQPKAHSGAGHPKGKSQFD